MSRSRWLISGAAVLFVATAFYALSQRLLPGDATSLSSAADETADAERHVVCLGYVDVAAGVASLSTVQPSRVLAVVVPENQHVAAGTVLLTADDRAAREAVHEAEAALRAASNQVAEAKRMAKRHAIKVQQQKAAVSASRARLAGAKRTLELKQTLSSLRQANEKEVAVAAELVREQEIGVEVHLASLAQLELVDPQYEVTQAETDVKRAEARLAQAQAAAEGQQIRSPTAGTVLRVLTRPGEIISAASPAIVFVPDGPRVVRAEVEQAEVDRVAVGSSVTIEDDAVHSRQWRGRVAYVAGWYSKARTILPDATTFNDIPMVECLFTITEGGSPPRIGQRVRVHVDPPLRSNSPQPKQ
jgi:HlyD family secretion protein